MANLTPQQEQTVGELINRGIAANLQRWNVEREIATIVGGEIPEFVDFWGTYCAAMGDEATPLDAEDTAAAIAELQTQAKS